MKKILSHPLLSLIIRLIIGGIFIFFAIGKIADSTLFAKEISNYRIMPEFSLSIMSLSLPWIELICGLFLMSGIRLRSSAMICGVLTIIFIIAIGSAMFRGLDINCGCFSEVKVYVGWPKIIEDSFILIGLIQIYFFPRQRFTLEQIVINEHATV